MGASKQHDILPIRKEWRTLLYTYQMLADFLYIKKYILYWGRTGKKKKKKLNN